LDSRGGDIAGGGIVLPLAERHDVGPEVRTQTVDVGMLIKSVTVTIARSAPAAALEGLKPLPVE
jgi:hypothetical protein